MVSKKFNTQYKISVIQNQCFTLDMLDTNDGHWWLEATAAG